MAKYTNKLDSKKQVAFSGGLLKKLCETDRAVQQAVAALAEKVPARSNISLMTENSTDRNLLDEVMGKMTGAIVQAGTIRLVDRSNRALIEAEQRFQTSGAVDDNSMVSLGRQLGVRYMSFIRISGVSSGRKLYLRILDIETSRVIYQGNFEI